MAGKLSLQIGNWLYKNAFPVYNMVYPVFKKRQDRHEIEFISKTLQPGSVVLDIGANIGFYTRILSNLTGPKGKVIAFEPDAANFARLQQNTRLLGNVSVHQLAVSSSNESLKIYHSKELNVDHRTYPVDDYASITEIAATTIDSFLEPGTRIDFIKMDIQGFEIEALKGMKNTIANNNVRMIMEFWPYGLRKAGKSVSELVALLDEYNLEYRLTEKEGSFNPADDDYENWGIEKFTNLYVTKKH